MTKLSVALVCLIVAGCATEPNKIGAQYVSPMQYQSYDCQQIALEQSRIERRTNVLYQSLKNEANADSWQMGIGLVLFWPAMFMLEGGDGPEAVEYARLRGEYEALDINSVSKKCELQFAENLNEFVKSEHSADGVRRYRTYSRID